MYDPARHNERTSGTHACSCGCGHGMTRRGFLGNVGGATLLGGATLMLASEACAEVQPQPLAAGRLPVGKTLRVQPVLAYDCPQPAEKTSWRGYGGVQTPEAAQKEAARIQADLQRLTPTLEPSVGGLITLWSSRRPPRPEVSASAM